MQMFYFLISVLMLAQACASGNAEDGNRASEVAAVSTLQPISAYSGPLPLESLVLPAGYGIDVFAENIENARSMAYAGNGLVFVGSRDEGNVYAVHDVDGDLRADTVYVLASGMNMPNGVALKGEDLYLATVDTIWRWTNIRSKLNAPGNPEVVYGGYPSEKHHGWKYIAFGPDDKLYVPVGAPCNICDKGAEGYATITRLDVDTPGAKPEIVARGVRNTVGFNWHPVSGELWFTDNGRDMLGDDTPPCEFNRLANEGQHFGYPYVHGGTILDPEFGEGHRTDDYVAPVQNLGAHVAPLGFEFVTSPAFSGFSESALIAEHGSWNRTEPIGYRITRVPIQADTSASGYEVFIEGWLQNGEAWGRPVDLEWLPDGSLLISDDFANVIYRVYKQA